MDLEYTPEEQAFRQKVAHWISENAPPASERRDVEALRAWQRRLYAAGYLGAGWPAEYGGATLTEMQQAIFNEELARANAPSADQRHGDLVGWPRYHPLRHRRAEKALPGDRSSPRRRSGRRATPSPARAATWPRRSAALYATATPTSSTARKSGRRSRTSRTGSSFSCAPRPRGRSGRASASC